MSARRRKIEAEPSESSQQTAKYIYDNLIRCEAEKPCERCIGIIARELERVRRIREKGR